MKITADGITGKIYSIEEACCQKFKEFFAKFKPLHVSHHGIWINALDCGIDYCPWCGHKLEIG